MRRKRIDPHSGRARPYTRDNRGRGIPMSPIGLLLGTPLPPYGNFAVANRRGKRANADPSLRDARVEVRVSDAQKSREGGDQKIRLSGVLRQCLFKSAHRADVKAIFAFLEAITRAVVAIAAFRQVNRDDDPVRS